MKKFKCNKEKHCYFFIVKDKKDQNAILDPIRILFHNRFAHHPKIKQYIIGIGNDKESEAVIIEFWRDIYKGLYDKDLLKIANGIYNGESIDGGSIDG